MYRHNLCCGWLILFILQQLSHHLFEELASDVYDEVDRRECDAGIAFNFPLNLPEERTT